MLVFIDESGDTGLKLEDGSSRFFTVALVAFDEDDEAIACDWRIQLLKKELGFPPEYEFHFKRNSDRIRESFLKAVSPYGFFYYGIVINKDPKKLWGEGFKNKESFYKYACSLVFENAKSKLCEAIVIIDESSSEDFQRRLGTYLRRKLKSKEGKCMVKKLKMQRSSSNNLLQLADYVAGVVNRFVSDKKKDAGSFRKIIAHREIDIQVWPK